MKLWLIEQDVNNGYDTYDSAVVAAETESEAILISPEGYVWSDGTWWGVRSDGQHYETGRYSAWAKPSDVKAKQLGTAEPGTEKGVILASFNAG